MDNQPNKDGENVPAAQESVNPVPDALDATQPADIAPGAADAAPSTAPGDEPDPNAPADPDDVVELEERFEELSTLLVKVDNHVSDKLDEVTAGEDDDTDPAYTSDAAEHSVHVRLAYDVERQAKSILTKEVLTNQDVETLDTVLDDLDSRINEATPSSFDPNA